MPRRSNDGPPRPADAPAKGVLPVAGAIASADTQSPEGAPNEIPDNIRVSAGEKDFAFRIAALWLRTSSVGISVKSRRFMVSDFGKRLASLSTIGCKGRDIDKE